MEVRVTCTSRFYVGHNLRDGGRDARKIVMDAVGNWDTDRLARMYQRPCGKQHLSGYVSRISLKEKVTEPQRCVVPQLHLQLQCLSLTK